MGTSRTEIVTPTPPPQPTTAEAMQAYAENLPAIYQTQLEYLPKFAELSKGISEQLYPQTAAIQEQLAQEALQQAQAGEVPPEIQQEYLSNLRANLGTNIGSPIAADYTSRQMLNLQQDWRNYYRNLALTLAGRQQLVQSPSYQTMYGGFSPNSVMQYKAATYGPYARASQPIVTSGGGFSPGGFLGGGLAGVMGASALGVTNPWMLAGAGLMGGLSGGL